MKFSWEEINSLDSYKTYRAKVFGGWIVSLEIRIGMYYKNESLVFVPDPEHKWEIDNE